MGFGWSNEYQAILVNFMNLFGRRCYYANTDAVIYVIDSCDRDRISTSKEELMQMLQEEELKNAALLVFANKQDMEGAMSVSEVSEFMGLTDLKTRTWTMYEFRN